ncbi:MRC [Mytilus coruscus]|uniref:MRC n=1 Tax=Mytilus coruscus TaxID=42192 RepID=A0A6J8BJW7_MYTCO|nr:MRC [Mytilus coruscus]
MYLLTFVVILALATFDVFSLPCLSSKAKKEFETVRQKLKTLHADLGKKVLGLDTDLKSIETDLAKKQWRKYNGHCYYLGDDVKSWFDAERKCKHIGGHLVKIDDKSENNWLKSQLAVESGMTVYAPIHLCIFVKIIFAIKRKRKSHLEVENTIERFIKYLF